MRRRLALAVGAAAAVLALGACSSGRGTDDLVIDVDLESVNKVIHKVGAAEQYLYGWNDLTGTSTAAEGDRHVELQATVNYVDGSGPCTGQLTITEPDGSVLAAALVHCEAFAKSATSGARFASDMRIIGGTGIHEGAVGTGVFVGERIDAIGGLVRSRFSFRFSGDALSMPNVEDRARP